MTEKKMQLVDWLDDLCVRFIINLPQEELESVERICFQIEEAQWFYEDFIRPADPSLPQLGLSEFASRLMKHCPLTAGYSNDLHALAFKQFMAYKTRVPVRGAILLDADMDRVLLVKGYKKNATWSFPRGKINKDEDDLVCAIREVWEETGYDIEGAGLVPKDRNVHYIDVTMREQHLRMFVFRSVPLDTPFEPQTRKEISKIQWYKLSSLPTFNSKRRSQPLVDTGDPDAISASKLYMVAPFLHSLKKWINQQKKLDPHRLTAHARGPRDIQDASSDVPAENDPVEPLDARVDIANPADELRRLLALGPTVSPATAGLPQYTDIPSDGHQADALLAMLRGSSSNIPQPLVNNPQPRTPMEQLLGHPDQPRSPHVLHVKASPHATRQPPPDFQLSPNRNSMQDASRSFQQLDLNHHPDTHSGNLSFQNHPPQHFFQIPQPQVHNMAQFAPANPTPSYTQQQPFSHLQDPQQAVASLQPQGHGAIAHGPAAPKASQLPPPNMSSHTMNLLNVLKTPSSQHRTLHTQSQTQHYSTAPVSQQPRQASDHFFASHGDNGAPRPPLHRPVHAQHEQPAATPPIAPSRSQHQNSLLHLFKSPAPPNATLASQDDQSQQRVTSMQAVPTYASAPRAQVEGRGAEIVKQRSSTVAMMTRTLPKAKAVSPKVPDVPTIRGGEAVTDLSSATQVVVEAQSSSINSSASATPAKAVEESTSKVAYKILSRPASKPGSTSASKIPPTPPGISASSPRKTRPSKATEHNSEQSFTILRRPSSAKQEVLPRTRQVLPRSPAQSEEAIKAFQPQLLRRPKGHEIDASTTVLGKPSKQSLGGGEQRDTLLALFAKSGQGKNNSVDPITSRMGPSSSGSASPLPMGPASFRSRIASNASGMSNGDGMRSPATPVEAKGFLMDYLNGVVKEEHHRNTRKPQ